MFTAAASVKLCPIFESPWIGKTWVGLSGS